jgi:hypothetical protein
MVRLSILLFTALISMAVAAAATPSIPTDQEVWVLVLAAIKADDDAKIAALFSQYPSQLSNVDVNIGGNSTFLQYAASFCSVRAATVLLQKGADPNKSYSPVTTQNSLTLISAAQSCSESDEVNARSMIKLLFQSGAKANPVSSPGNFQYTIPQAQQFLQQCTSRVNYVPSFLPVLEEWLLGGLNPASAPTNPAGKADVNLLHFVAYDLSSNLCTEAAILLSRNAKPNDFSAVDSKGRFPIDYTLGSTFQGTDTDGSVYRIIDCFAYVRNDDHSTEHVNRSKVISTYENAGSPPPDINRACPHRGENTQPFTGIGIDSNGNKFIFQERWLPAITENATTDDPGCQDPPGGWSRCGLLQAESIPGVYVLLPGTVQAFAKEDDGRCGKFDPSKNQTPERDLGYTLCGGGGRCLNWSRYFEISRETDPAGRILNSIKYLAKNWSDHRNRCYALKIYLGP